MEQLLTKCCQAERVADRDEYGMPIRLYCEECEGNDPVMEWVYIEMKCPSCDGHGGWYDGTGQNAEPRECEVCEGTGEKNETEESA